MTDRSKNQGILIGDMEVLSENELRLYCPLKWHEGIPEGGIGLGIADIDFKGPEGIVEWISSRLTEEYHFYQKREGLDFAIEAVKEFLKRKEMANATIQLIPGTMAGIYASMKFASSMEGEVAIVNPIYPPVHFHASSEKNRIAWVGLDDQYRLDHDSLQETVSTDTKLLGIVHPNNPTGTVFTDEDFRLIRDLAVDYDFICFSDELYDPLAFNGAKKSLGSFEGMENRTITLFGFSKAYGLAGLRAGFMAIQLQDSTKIQEIVEHLLVSPSPVTSIVTEYALKEEKVLKWVKDFRETMRVNMEFASKVFDDEGYSCPKPDGGLFVFPDIGKKDDVRFCDQLLREKGVEVVPGSKFGPDGIGHIRVNCATSMERLEDGIGRIIEFLSYDK